MPRKLTPATTLDHLRKQAKRWLKALRENNAEARERFRSAYPGGPEQPGLRDVQHALALVYGQTSWISLKAAIETQSAAAPSPTTDVTSETPSRWATPAGRFLEYACPDHHVRGRPAHEMARHAAM